MGPTWKHQVIADGSPIIKAGRGLARDSASGTGKRIRTCYGFAVGSNLDGGRKVMGLLSYRLCALRAYAGLN